MQKDSLRFDINERPPLYMAFGLALTHVFLIFDGVIFVPNVLGKAAGLDPQTLQFITFGSIVVAALFTYLQSRRAFGIGAGFILFTGSYSAFLACSLDAVDMGGMALVGTMGLLSVPVVFVYTFFIRHFRHIITPAVGGVVILLIAVSMVPISLDLWSGGGTTPGAPDTIARLLVGGLTIFALTSLMLFGNATLKIWSPPIAMACGYLSAFFTGQLDFSNTARAAWIGLPPLAWPGLETNITASHLPLLFAFAMAMVASMIESTGNIMLVQRISQRDFRRVSYDRIQGGLYCDGLSKVVAGLWGTAVPSTYCDNLPLVEITGVASRRVGVWGAGILLALAFLPKVSGVMLDMPGPVMGGFLLVVAALLFQAGIGLVTINRLSNQHGIILGLSLTVGLVAESGTFFPGVVPDSLSPVLQNSVAIGGFTAFFLSTLAYLAPRRGLHGTLRAATSEVAKLSKLLEDGRSKLRLSDRQLLHLNLCCEEVFLHMMNGNGSEDHSISFRISRTEDGIFTEAVCGHHMDDINNFAAPESFYHAKAEDLNQLGLVLFAKYAREVKHMDISGYSFISFYL